MRAALACLMLFFAAAPPAAALQVPYLPEGPFSLLTYELSWSGIGPVEVAGPIPDRATLDYPPQPPLGTRDDAFIVEAPPGASYLTIGVLTRSEAPTIAALRNNGALIDWDVLELDGAPGYAYHYADDVPLSTGLNDFRVTIEMDGADGQIGRGLVYFNNDPNAALPIPTPASIILMATALAVFARPGTSRRAARRARPGRFRSAAA